MKISVDRQRRIITVENDGQRTHRTLRQGLDRALKEFRDQGKFKLLVDWTSFKGPAPDSLMEQFNVSSHLALMCTAIAFVGDEVWAPAVEKAKLIFPDIPCERFDVDQRAQAEAWLADR